MKKINCFVACFFLLVNILHVSAQEKTSFPKFEVKNIADNTFMLVSILNENNSANLLVLTGPDGILLVDCGFSASAETLNNTIEELGVGEIKYVINTHYHLDHTGGNSFFGENALIFSHENVKRQLSSGEYLLYDLPQHSLPSITLTNEMTLYLNGEKIRLIHLKNGHTNGDVIIHFEKSNIVCMGDLLFADQFPYIEYYTGGNLKNYFGNIQKAIDMFPGNTMFLAGHGKIYTSDDLQNYHNSLIETIELVKSELDNGTSIEKMKQQDILEKWNLWADGFISKDMWIESIVTGLSENNYLAKKSIIDPLFPALAEKDITAVVEKYYELKNNHFEEYYFNDNILNMMGYFLLGKNRIEEALKIFLLNVEEYPLSFNVYDSLGEAYMINGDTELAARNYKKSLELNPENTNAEEKLEELLKNN